MKNYKLIHQLVFFSLFSVLGMSFSQGQEAHPFPEYLARVRAADSNRMTGLLGELPPGHSLQVNAREFLKNISRGTFVFGNHCSASFISSEGHALTALHCLARISKESVQGRLPLNLMLTPDRDLIGKEIQIPKQNLEQFGYTQAQSFGDRVKILAMGVGFPNSDMINRGALTAAYSEYNSDWALVKFEQLPATHSCVKVASQTLSKGSILWALGYPAVSDNKVQTLDWLYTGTPMFLTRFMKAGDDKNKLNKMLLDIYAFYRKIRYESANPDPYLIQESFKYNYSLYLSTGRYFADAKELIATTKWPLLESSTRIDVIYDKQKHFTSTVSIAGGLSGGGVYNTAGELVGINVASLGGPSIYESFQMGARHVLVKGLMGDLKSSLSASEFERAFDCK